MAAEQRHINDLLRRYLRLLDEYMRLRALLSGLQADVHQQIARANFSAERGTRYGQDHYDGRMRATRRLGIRRGDAGTPVFAVRGAGEPADGEQAAPAARRDPLRWFGLPAPAVLRRAQGSAVAAVERAVPQLASVHAEMLGVEAEVRRARKRRAKALASARKAEETSRPEAVETG